MKAEQLKASILNMAFQGKLTEQLDSDSSSLDFIESEKDKFKEFGWKSKKQKQIVDVLKSLNSPVIPDCWHWEKLGNISYSSIGLTYHPQDMCDRKGILVLRSSNIKKGQLVFDDNVWVRKDIVPSNKFCQPNDILVCVRNGSKKLVGKSAFIKDSGMSFGAFMSIVRCNFYQYLYLFFQSPYFKRQMHLDSSTETINQITQDMLYHCYVPIPPIEEQQRIVDKLNELLPLADEYGKYEQELSALNLAFPDKAKQSILQYAFQGKLTEQLDSDSSVEELLEKIKTEKQKLIKEGKLKKEKELEPITDEDILFCIPKNWKWLKLNFLVTKTIKRGKSPTYCDHSTTLVFAQKCNVKTGGINMVLALYLDETKLAKYDEEEFMQHQDIVINSTGRGTMGRVGFFHDEDNPRKLKIVPDSHVTVIRTCKCIADANYLYLFLKYRQTYLETLGDGSTNQTELKADIIKNLAVPLPPLEEQQRIVDKIEHLFSLIDTMKM